jgi:hypothetical protein
MRASARDTMARPKNTRAKKARNMTTSAPSSPMRAALTVEHMRQGETGTSMNAEST